MEYIDYYKILGVNKNATADEIKSAYRKLARKLHPDLNPNDKDAMKKFQEVNEANEVLGNPEKRKKYDELGQHWNQYQQTGVLSKLTSLGSNFKASGARFGPDQKAVPVDVVASLGKL